ncbi:synaptotagmin-like protein 2 isoform X2 [Embiotoca jacksoni]|uniref:synaptotagmin-like protein 2 isoform X2 n=1 Tax=Embiotoca jacksoni TaxID=100190 RepID=UPI003704A689
MIDLSHLTEEEQGMIMTVLRRDAELKKAEEERIRKLDTILSRGSSKSDSELKYLTGEWFYEAKSHRHLDKIHGSEIILASMKQGRAASLEGSPRFDRSKTPRGSDTMAPLKPARCLEARQPQEINDAEQENQTSVIHSPRMPRHNPFNRASLIVAEPPQHDHDLSSSRDWESSETEPISPWKNHPAAEVSQTSAGGCVPSEGLPEGFRPVPKKRTFLSRRTCSQSESSSAGSDTQGGSGRIVPAPRRSLQQGSSGISNQSCLKSPDETPQESAVMVSNEVTQCVQPSRCAEKTSLQLRGNASQVSSNSSQERGTSSSSTTRDRPAAYSRSDESTERETPPRSGERDDQTGREPAALNLVDLQTSDVQTQQNSSRGTAARPEELSLHQSTVDADPPVSYDLNFIDKSDQQTQKSNQTHVFKLSTQATSPTGDEEESIAKVLDWFSRSMDSSDWLNADDNKHVSKSRGEDLSARNVGAMASDRKTETPETKRSHRQIQAGDDKEFRAAGRISKEPNETREEVENGGRMHSQDVKDVDEGQPPKISQLKSFWEKSNTGPKILVSKSVGDKGQKPAHLSVETESDNPSVPGRYIHDTSKPTDEREPQTDGVHLNNHRPRDKRNNNDSKYTSDYLKLLSSPQIADGTGSDIGPESESVSSVKPNPQPDSMSDTRESLRQDELSKTVPADTCLQTRCGLDSEGLGLSRSSPDVDYKQGGGDVHITTKTQNGKGSNEDVKRKDSEDRSVHSSTSPKRKEDASGKDRTNSAHSNRQGLAHQESTAERIKQLKSFWEQERNKPMFYTGKPKPLGDAKMSRGANQAKLNKRFTKSEYDLRSIGKESDSDEEDKNPNFTVLPMNQKLDRMSPSLGTSRTQFNTLREFWGEATSDSKGLFHFDKPKSPKKKEPVNTQLSSQELKSADPEIYRLSSAVEKTRPPVTKSSSPPQNRSKSPHDRQTASGSRPPSDGKNNLSDYTPAESGQQRQSKRSSKDPGREEKSTKPQISPRKESRSPKSRKDGLGCSSGRGNSLRRATSMFALTPADQDDQAELKIDVSPVRSQSRKQRQSTDKGAGSRRSSEETDGLTLRARAFVPRDYRHYLGMTENTSVHASLRPAPKGDASDGESGHELNPSGPARAGTPASSEERYIRKGSRTSQRPPWANYSGSDTGRESSVSSTSEGWSTSRNSSTRENDNDLNPVRKALRRAETRPKILAKSMEDITASSSPRQERRPDPAADLRRISDGSTLESPSSSLFSDPDHLKKMSKSVPSFLQEEDAGRDADSVCEDGFHRGRLAMGSSMTNLTGPSGTASLSGSVMTVYSGENVEVQGSIQFSINYIQKLREFHIFVSECRDLAAVDPKRSRSDPYVKSYLAPDKANLGKRKTSVKKKTLNPSFNEILRYRVRLEYLRTQTLILSVWHHDTFGRNSFLGEVDVDLSKWDFDHTQMNYSALKARTTPTLAPSNGRGEMRLAIRFLPQIPHSEDVAKDVPNTGEIHIWVKECKNLPLFRASIDPYVKCFVLPDTSRKSRQKTRVLRRTVDPAFNHTMVYDGIREADLREACVELTVWDRDRLASHLLGGLRLGAGTGRSYGAAVDWMDSSPYEVALWERMMAAPNEWVEEALPLRVLNSARAAFK